MTNEENRQKNKNTISRLEGENIKLKEKIQNIKATAEQLKKNGASKLSESDMLIYLIERIDGLPCFAQGRTIAKNDARIKILMWFMALYATITTTIYLYLFGIIINRIF